MCLGKAISSEGCHQLPDAIGGLLRHAVTGIGAGSELTLTWSAAPGYIYRVQQRVGIMDPSWTDAEGDVIAGESTASKTVSMPDASSFYRVVGFSP